MLPFALIFIFILVFNIRIDNKNIKKLNNVWSMFQKLCPNPSILFITPTVLV